MKCQFLFVVFLAVPLCSSEDIYAELKGRVILTPTGSQTVSSVVWKSGNDKVAEYDPAFDKDAQYYGNFKGRTELNLASGNITIIDLTDKDNGEFSVEINNMQQAVKFSLKVIPPVSNPTISRDDTNKECVLVCKAENSIEYKWTGKGELAKEKYMLIVSQDDPSEVYICNAINQAGWRSATVKTEEICGGGLGPEAKTAIWVSTVLGCLLSGGVIAIGFLHKKKGIWKRQNNHNANTGGNEQGNGEKSSNGESKELMEKSS